MFSTLAATGSQARATLDVLLSSWFPLYQTLEVQYVDLAGKNVIITGANAGIGLGSARKLAAFNANVTLACRDAAKGETARLDVVASTGNQNVEVRVLDVSSFESRVASNAGMTVLRFEKTKDGFETSYATNHLGPFLLTMLLLPSLAPHARIVNISSLGHYAGKQDPTDIDASIQIAKTFKEGDELPMKAWNQLYCDVKLAQVIFARELQRRLDASEEFAQKHIVTCSFHPVLVKSTIWNRHAGASSEVDKVIKQPSRLVNFFGISTEQGACTGVWAAVDPKLATGGGGYYARQRLAAPSPLALDDELRAKLWDAWITAVGITSPV